MANNDFRDKLRIKYLKVLANNEEKEAFINYFDESEQYINDIVNNQKQASAAILKDLIEVIQYRKTITLKQKI